MNRVELDQLLDDKEDFCKWGEETRQALRELADEYDGQVPLQQPKSSVSTAEVIDKFLASKKSANRSEATIKSYGDTLRPFACAYPTLPTTPEEIEAYLGEHRGNGTTGETIYIVIRLLYRWASNRLGVANPMPQVERPIAKAKPPQHLTITQAEALLNAIQTDREQGLVYCLFGLGLRLGEVIRLKVADIGEDTILVHGKERDEQLPLLPEIRDILLKLTDGKSPTEAVFQGRQGLLSDSTIQVIIKTLFDRAGITGVRPSPHTLRHTKGVLSTMLGLDQFSSKRLLRHASTEMTDRYNQLNLGELRLKDKQYNPLLRLLSKAELGKKPDFTQFKADTVLSDDPAELLPELLDRLIELGQMAQQLSHALGSNGHRPEAAKELISALLSTG